MKLRNGFVSNSSSSSFAIIGFQVTDELKKKIIDKYNEEAEESEKEEEKFWACEKCGFEPEKGKPKFCEQCGGEIKTLIRKIVPDKSDYEVFEAFDLEYHSKTDNGAIAGFSVEGCSTKQVLEFEKELVEIVGKNIDIKIMSGESYI
jgi:PHP family Zn ribbon phosphoesterase